MKREYIKPELMVKKYLLSTDINLENPSYNIGGGNSYGENATENVGSDSWIDLF